MSEQIQNFGFVQTYLCHKLHCKRDAPETLQKLLGHNSLQTTMDLYLHCHVLDETLKEEMATVVEMV